MTQYLYISDNSERSVETSITVKNLVTFSKPVKAKLWISGVMKFNERNRKINVACLWDKTKAKNNPINLLIADI